MGRYSLLSCIKRYIKGLQPINVNVKVTKVASTELLAGKTALITGASRGIGRAIATTFIDNGAVVIAVAKHEENLKKVQIELGSDKYLPLPYDLADTENIESLVAKALQLSPNGALDILVNAAGIKNGQESKFWEFTPSDFDDVMDVNIKSPFFLCQKVSNLMKARNIKGHIINLIGIKGFIGEPSPYSISKFGLTSLTKGIARMLAPYGIIVNGIAPGATKTDMIGITDDNMFHSDTANNRLADPQEIANIALFLASELSPNMIGSIVVSDGGEMLQYLNNRY